MSLSRFLAGMREVSQHQESMRKISRNQFLEPYFRDKVKSDAFRREQEDAVYKTQLQNDLKLEEQSIAANALTLEMNGIARDKQALFNSPEMLQVQKELYAQSLDLQGHRQQKEILAIAQTQQVEQNAIDAEETTQARIIELSQQAQGLIQPSDPIVVDELAIDAELEVRQDAFFADQDQARDNSLSVFEKENSGNLEIRNILEGAREGQVSFTKRTRRGRGAKITTGETAGRIIPGVSRSRKKQLEDAGLKFEAKKKISRARRNGGGNTTYDIEFTEDQFQEAQSRFNPEFVEPEFEEFDAVGEREALFEGERQRLEKEKKSRNVEKFIKIRTEISQLNPGDNPLIQEQLNTLRKKLRASDPELAQGVDNAIFLKNFQPQPYFLKKAFEEQHEETFRHIRSGNYPSDSLAMIEHQLGAFQQAYLKDPLKYREVGSDGKPLTERQDKRLSVARSAQRLKATLEGFGTDEVPARPNFFRRFDTEESKIWGRIDSLLEDFGRLQSGGVISEQELVSFRQIALGRSLSAKDRYEQLIQFANEKIEDAVADGLEGRLGLGKQTEAAQGNKKVVNENLLKI